MRMSYWSSDVCSSELVDMADTGRRTAALLDKILTEGKPAKAHRQLDFLIPLSWQCTMAEPSGPIYDRMTALEVDGVWSTSYLPGFPAADIVDCGPTVLAYGSTQADAEDRKSTRLNSSH